MEQLGLIIFLIQAAIVGCVGYSAWSLIVWFISLFGGVCVGCNS